MEGSNICPRCGVSAGDSLFCEQCGVKLSSEADQVDPLIGRTIGDKYRIDALLGSGAMGRIYRSEHSALERTVALKVLHPHLTYNESLVHRFLREARAASRLSHPNIVTLLDFGQDAEDGLLYLVMEHLEGRSLQSFIDDDGPLEMGRLLHLAKQILLAVDEAHAQNIVHRDLKPENIIILPTRHGEQVKVVDFGLAQLVGTDDVKLTSTGLVCGTPSYISPEQARAADVGPLTDIYSFGVMLYEMVTGVLPFEATGAYEMVSKHLTEMPVPPAKRVRGRQIPEDLSRLVLRCLEKSPSQRPANAVEVHDALLAVEQSLAGAAPPLAALISSELPVATPEREVECPACGRRMPREAQFCGSCGTDMKAPSTCAICGAPKGDCTCGPSPVATGVGSPIDGPLDDLEHEPTVVPPSDELKRLKQHLPERVLQALLEGQSLLQSPRRQITVLFADLSAVHSGVVDLDVLINAISRGLELMMGCVQHNEGIAQRFIGDCLVALFGAPLYHEDDPARGVQAALDMRHELAGLNLELPAHLALRVGVACETVVTGPADSGSLDMGAVARVVRQAQRLQTAAELDAILISDPVRRELSLAGASVDLNQLPAMDLGDGPTDLFEVPRRPPPPILEPISVPSSLLVGRSAERAIIESAGRLAVEGRGSAMLLVGEPGIGKSALMSHLARSLRELGMKTHLTSSTSGGSRSTAGQLLRSVLNCPPDASDGQVQGRLADVEGLDETDRAALAFLALSSSRSSTSMPILALDLTCFTAVRRLLQLLTAEAPIAVLLDDCRLLNDRERQLVTQISGMIDEHRLLLVLADREQDPALVDAGVRPMVLGPLQPGEAEMLLRKLAGDRLVDAETVQRVQESSGGNPLYLVETARYLDREGYLSAGRPQGRRRAITVPANIHALVTTRFDTLDPLAKDALVHAALIGRPFTPTLLARMLPDAPGLHLTLEELEDSGLLERQESGPANLRLRFRHALVRETLCSTLTDEKRRGTHDRIASLLLEGADPEVPAAEIGRQLELAGRDSDAAGQYELAANEQVERGQPEAAAQYFKRAVEALERVDSADPLRIIDLKIFVAHALNRANRWQEARDIALAARNEALPTGDVVLAARASHELARAAAEQGDLQLADSVLREAYQTALACSELDLAAELASTLGETQERGGDLQQALETLESAYRRLEGTARRSRTSQTSVAAGRVAEVLNRLGRVMIRMDRAGDAIGYLRTALKQSRLAADVILEGRVLGNLGRAESLSGNPTSALETLDRALRTMQQAGDRVGIAKLLHNLAHLHLESGQRDRAAALAQQSLKLSVEIGWREGEAMTAEFLDRIG